MTLEPLLPTPTVEDAGREGSLEAWKKYKNEKRGTHNRLRNAIHQAEELISSLVASPANLFPMPDEELERKITATSGRRCFESYESFIRGGSLVKTLADSLLGAKVWYSNKRTLTWKMKATKCSRLLFQLFPSTRRTEGIGSGFVPTTPSTRDWKDTPNKTKNRSNRKERLDQMPRQVGKAAGLKLQPAFVLWMMGYPMDWLDLEDGEMPPSKARATRLSPKSQPKSSKQSKQLPRE